MVTELYLKYLNISLWNRSTVQKQDLVKTEIKT